MIKWEKMIKFAFFHRFPREIARLATDICATYSSVQPQNIQSPIPVRCNINKSSIFDNGRDSHVMGRESPSF